MSADDPILRATAGGDPACPDGRALSELGRIAREVAAPPRRVDLVDRVMRRIDAERDAAPAPTEEIFEEHVDRWYDEDDRSGIDPVIAQLGELIRAAARPPHAVDLVGRVDRRLAGASRESVARLTVPEDTRWRIWSAVVAGHVAALVALAIYQLGSAGGDATTARSGETAASAYEITVGRDEHAGDRGRRAAAVDPLAGIHRPQSWIQLAQASGDDADLMRLRRSAQLRATARIAYGFEPSGGAVDAGLAWLLSSQDLGTGAFGTLAGDAERDVAVQALACLAVLGAGLDQPERAEAARRSLAWVRTALEGGMLQPGNLAAGIGCLALVEGALLQDDLQLRLAAEAALARLDAAGGYQPGNAGLGGFTLLAMETAAAGGLRVPPRALVQARIAIGRALPDDDAGTGRIGLAAFARLIIGRAANPPTERLIQHLSAQPPLADAAGRIDPMGWFFATLALRESGGEGWRSWAKALQDALLGACDPATGRVRVDRVAYASATPNAEVFATALVLLNLEAPYRYVPLARP